MMTEYPENRQITSFTCKCVITEDNFYLYEPSPQMLKFFGTAEASYQSGILSRIRKDISPNSASAIASVAFPHAKAGEDFRVTYPTIRADGSSCYIQADASFIGWSDAGAIYSAICMDVTALIEATKSESRLLAENRALLEDSPVGLGIYHNQGTAFDLVYTNPEYARVHHGSKEYWDSFQGKDALERIFPEDREILRAEWERVVKSSPNELFDASYRCRGEDGTIHWVRLLGRILREEDNKYTCYASYLDIDREKAAEEKLAREYADQQAYLDTIADNYVATLRVNLTLDTVETATRVNPILRSEQPKRYTDLLEIIRAAMPRQADRELLRQRFSREALLKTYPGKNSVSMEYYQRTAHTAPHWMRLTIHLAQRPASGDMVAFAVMADITGEVISRRLSDKIITQTYETVSYCDVTSGLFYVKSGLEALEVPSDGVPYESAIRASAERSVGKEHIEEVIGLFSMDHVRAELEQHPVYTFYYTRQPADTQIHMKCDASYLDETHDIIVFLLTDVTAVFELEREHREKLTEALMAAEQASVAKTEFLSRMSHEIRTPMNAIIGLDSIALQEKDLSQTMEDHLQKIGISARFLLSLINDILDMSRIESGRMALKEERFNFEELVDGINTILYEQCRNSRLDYDCILKSYTEEYYVGDATKLQQILINILGNAVKFTPSGGKVRFQIEQLSRTKEKAALRFEISDTGIGIDDDFLPHLFEPFSQENRGRTSAYGGTGLGLAISKNIVGLMGGSIGVHSVKNVGTTFTVEVPLGLSAECIRRKALLDASGLRPLRTLVVDDDELVCRHTQQLLADAGLIAEWVDSGARAVARVTEQHELRTDFDLILLDLKMPDMDGVETARQIRLVVGPEVTIIVMTAYDWADIEAQARAAGVDSFMKKPVFLPAIRKAYEHAFYSKQSAGEPEKAPDYDFTGKCLLLAEDNALNAEIAQHILEMKGARIELAQNGAEAIELFVTQPVGHYDAILMDVRMPVMDGLEATRTIRAMKKADSKTIPILAMTANAFQEDVKASLDAGMNAHLAKPIEPSVLYQTLSRYLKC